MTAAVLLRRRRAVTAGSGSRSARLSRSTPAGRRRPALRHGPGAGGRTTRARRARLAPIVAAGLVLALAGADPGVSTAGQSDSALVTLPAPGSPLVTLRIGFRTGSVDDPAGKNGLNALTALTMGRGGTEAMTYEAITEALYPWSASIRAQFDKEMTVIVGEVHRDHLDPFFEILRDLVTAPRFDPSDFERNRDFLTNTVVSTLRGSDDEELGKEALNALLYAGHPYAAPAVGTEQGLAALTLDDVRAFHREHYTRSRVLAGVAGGYPAGFAERVERELLDRLPPTGGPGPAALPAPRALDGVELLLVDKDAIATAISIGFPIDLTRAGDDFYALMVANSYFGEHRTFNGLLMNKMRGQRGLNYGDYSYIEHFVQDGGSRLPVPNIPRRQQFFSIWIRPVPHHNAHFALRQALRELRVLVDEGLGDADFEATREFLVNYSKLYVQTSEPPSRLPHGLGGVRRGVLHRRDPAPAARADRRRRQRRDPAPPAGRRSRGRRRHPRRRRVPRPPARERAVAAHLQRRGDRRDPRRGRTDRGVRDRGQSREGAGGPGRRRCSARCPWRPGPISETEISPPEAELSAAQTRQRKGRRRARSAAHATDHRPDLRPADSRRQAQAAPPRMGRRPVAPPPRRRAAAALFMPPCPIPSRPPPCSLAPPPRWRSSTP